MKSVLYGRALLPFLVLFSVCFSVSSFGQVNNIPCAPDPSVCQFSVETDTIELAEYPGCKIVVTYGRSDCPSYIQIYLDHFSFYGNAVTCFNFSNHYFNYLSLPAHVEEKVLFHDRIMLKVALDIFKVARSNPVYQCLGSSQPDCNLPGYFEVRIITPYCLRFWDFDFDPQSGNEEGHYLGKSACGTACCVHAVKMCYTGTTTRYTVCPLSINVDNPCDNANPIKPEGSHWTSECINACFIPNRYVGPPKD